MNISIIGVGKLGLCLGLNLERSGHNIVAIDVNETYIECLKNKTFKTTEPFVCEYLNSSNINFSTDIKKSLENDIIFIVVQTPSTPEWKYDHSHIETIADKLISFGKQPSRKDIIINCTTFPGYCEKLNDRLEKYNYHVSYNPEFIAQGSIINDQKYCDLVLIGESDKYIGNVIEQIYSSICLSKPTIHRMTPTEAEITKLSINCFLTTKISFANMIGDISLNYKCNPDVVLNAIGSDTRIGKKYLKYGFGFGGPCFPRDNKALAKCASEVGIDATISNATDVYNTLHLENQINNFITENSDKSKEIHIDQVSYKKGIPILEESQQLKYALKLQNLGYSITIHETAETIELLKKSYGNKFKYIIK